MSYMFLISQFALLLLCLGIPLLSLFKERSSNSRMRRYHPGTSSQWHMLFSLLLLGSSILLIWLEFVIGVQTIWVLFFALGVLFFLGSILAFFLEKKIAKSRSARPDTRRRSSK